MSLLSTKSKGILSHLGDLEYRSTRILSVGYDFLRSLFFPVPQCCENKKFVQFKCVE